MPLSRSWLLAIALAPAAPAWADTTAVDTQAAAPPIVAPLGHHGQAFAVSQGAKARVVEPDGRIVTANAGSDLVAPSSIAEERTKTAIARLIRTEALAKAARPAQAGALVKLQEP